MIRGPGVAAALLVAMLWPAAAPAQGPAALLEQAEQRLASARPGLEQRRALGDAIRAYEEAILELQEDASGVAARARTRARALDAERRDLARLMSALTRLGRAAEPMVLTSAADPVDGVRALLLLERTADAARARVARLEDERAALEDMRAEQAALLARMEATHARLSEMRQTLIERIEEERAEAGPMPDIGADATNLAALAIALESGMQEAGAPPPAAQVLEPPVAGRILRRFGDEDAAGVARPGIAVATAPASLVTSPVAATVRYTGELDGYGDVVILEPAESLLLVFGGLGPILVQSGENVIAGAVLAFMPGEADALHEEFSQSGARETGQAGAKTLYIEVRSGQQPVDPLLWFEGYR